MAQYTLDNKKERKRNEAVPPPYMSSKSVRMGSCGYGVVYALKLNKNTWGGEKKEAPQKKGCCLFFSLSSLLCLQQCLAVSNYALRVHGKNVIEYITARQRMRE